MYMLWFSRLAMQMVDKGIWFDIDYKNAGGIFAFTKEGIPAIIVGHELSVEEKVIAISHELGHYAQFKEIAYGDITMWRLVKEQTPAVILEEDAWEKAVEILHAVGFDEWEEFRTEASSCIGTYYMKDCGFIECIDKCHMFNLKMLKYIDSITESPVLC